jgi:hypothetical protein
MYGASSSYSQLHLGSELIPPLGEREPVASRQVYRTSEGEAPRHIRLLRLRWPGESGRATPGCGRAKGGNEAAPWRGVGTTRACCGSGNGESADTSGDASSSLPSGHLSAAHSQGFESERRRAGLAMRNTCRALRLAAAVREDAGRFWAGAVHTPSRGRSPPLGVLGACVGAHQGGDATIDTLYGLLGCPGDLEA